MLAAAAGRAVVAAARATMLSVVMDFLIIMTSQGLKLYNFAADHLSGETVIVLNIPTGQAPNQHILTGAQQVVTGNSAEFS